MTAHVLRWALSELALRRCVVLATVLTTSGSVPGKTGARLAMSSHQHAWKGTVGGAGLEHLVLVRCEELLKTSHRPTAEVVTYGLNKGAKGYEVTPLDSLCGGRVTISIEVMTPMPHVLLLGGGHCGEALAQTIHGLGWAHSVHDTRPEFATKERYPHAQQCSTGPVDEFMTALIANDLSFFSDVLLLGHDWSEDQQRLLLLLQAVAGTPSLDGETAPRIGVIGSRSKWQAFEAHCLEQGVEASLLNQVVCPIGLNIGAETPEEIAVAVAAQIMASHTRVDPTAPNWRHS